MLTVGVLFTPTLYNPICKGQ